MSCIIVLGDGAAQALSAAGVPVDPMPFRDEISVGPLHAIGAAGDDAADAAFAALRGAFWSEGLAAVGAGAPGGPPPEALPPGEAIAAQLAALRAMIRAGESVELWLEGSLQEWMLAALLARMTAGSAATLSLRLFPAEAPRGLACVAPGDLLKPPPALASTSENREALLAFWSALIAPDPAQFVALAAGAASDPEAAPPAAALAARLRRLPDAATGLTHEQTLLIERMDETPRPVRRIIGDALRDAPPPDSLGDLHLARVLLELADSSRAHPPVRLDPAGASLWEAQAALTGFGARLKAGEADRLAADPVRLRLGGWDLPASGPGAWRHSAGSAAPG